MARPKKSDAPDLAERVNLTAGAIERLTCPAGKQQAFMRDSEVPGLRVRVTAAGAKSFVYESKLNRQTIRRTIGDVKAWSIEQARIEARRRFSARRMEMTVIAVRTELIAWYARRGYAPTGETRPFPVDPPRPELDFVVLEKAL